MREELSFDTDLREQAGPWCLGRSLATVKSRQCLFINLFAGRQLFVLKWEYDNRTLSSSLLSHAR